MSGVSRCDFVIELDLRCWTAPEQTPIAIEEQLQILGKLRAWLQSCGYRTNVDLPKDVAQDNRPCIWAGCEERCYRAMAICPKHYDLSLLRPE
ncbi:hypothetical protein GC176_07355 [bacterium]|nr:hypothetical protein [bacterium]